MTPPASRRPAASEPSPSPERIVDVDLTDEMADSFLEYAYSVIYQRALPDARDGLKPVQRRIIYQMSEMGLTPEKGHVKSARVVGEVMGKLHPHGDQAIYDALVRLAQDFTLRVPLVDGHGNFGSLDDGPAAARYTEARLRPEAVAMAESLDEDVVDFIPNYDNQLLQPEVLPAALPNLLVNGASGIAVGMATNMAPHNLREVIDAARALLDNQEITTEQLMELVPGPDLPGGGIIISGDGLREAYATGRGSFRMRATVSVEPVGPRSQGLVITELPFLVGPEKVIEKIKDGVQSNKIQGISDVTDLTDRKNGLRLIVTVKTGFDPVKVLHQLYRLTPLEENFSINNVALVGGQPRTLGLRDLLQVYLDHRIEVTTRRSAHRLSTTTERLHLVEGLLIAIVNIDEVIQVIRTSDDSAAARSRLRDVFDLSEPQADYILELRLRRLTKFSRIELETERDSLEATRAYLSELLGSPAKIRAVVSQELQEVADRFGTPRRTRLMDESDNEVITTSAKSAPSSLEITDQPCWVVVSATGQAVRVDRSEDQAPPAVASKRAPHDGMMAVFPTTTRSPIGVVTADGTVTRLEPADFPLFEGSPVSVAKGLALRDIAGLGKEHGVVRGVFPLGASAPTIALGTAHGVVKRIDLSTLPDKPTTSIIQLKERDQVVGAGVAPDESWLVFISDKAQLLRYPASQVRPQGASAAGMTGMSLADDAEIVAFHAVAHEEAQVVTISSSREALAGTNAGRAKVTALKHFPSKGRATGGVRAHAFLKGEDMIQLAGVFVSPRALAHRGQPVALPEPTDKRDGSGVVLETAVQSIGDELVF